MSDSQKSPATSSTDTLDHNANFRINSTVWQSFKAALGDENASDDLRRYVRDRIGFDETLPGMRERIDTLHEEADDIDSQADELVARAERLNEEADARRREAETIEERITDIEHEQMSPRDRAFEHLVECVEAGDNLVLTGHSDVETMFDADGMTTQGVDAIMEWYDTLREDLLEAADVNEKEVTILISD